ncbi:MAG: alpha/beta hydrolase [Prolixibacteraceae bacterium]|jgi:pimeloyl-ACP methyl ester carboxylesterase
MKALVNPQKCTVSGHSINYYREGTGETIILVHGITTYSFIWIELFYSLKNQFDVIAVDLLGCGESDKSIDVDYSIKYQTNLIFEFIVQLKLEKIHIVGHDVGGGLAQIFTVRHPESVITSTFVNPVGYDFWPVQPIVAMRTPIVRQLAMATLDFGMFKLIVQRGVFYKERVTTELMNYFFKPMRTKLGRKAFLHFASCLDNRNLLEISDELKQIKTPVLIVRGEADVYLRPDISLKLNHEIPGSQLVIISDAGHFIQFDVPDQLYTTLLEFIKTHHYAA